MIKKLLSILLVLTASSAFSNEIDANCPKHVYKSAPVSVLPDQYLCHNGNAIAYSYATKTPVYVAEYLDASPKGLVARGSNFRADPKIPKKYTSKVSEYKDSGDLCGGGSCDKGHLQPDQNASGDRKSSYESYYLSNVVPQNYQNNRGVWKYLEGKVLAYASQKNPVYVITGVIYTKQPLTTLSGGTAIPDKLFKVVIDSLSGESITFVLDNAPLPVGNLNGKVTNLRTLEQLTGISFDQSLNKDSKASYQAWFSGLF